MKTFHTLTLGFLLVFVQSSCNDSIVPDGEVILENREVSEFSKIDVSDAFQVELLMTDTEEELIIEAEENLLDIIETEVRGTTLFIGIEEGINLRKSPTLIAHLKADDIDAITISGASSVDLENEIETQNLSLNLSGASRFEGELKVTNFVINESGASNVELSGTADKVKAQIEGASKLRDFTFEIDLLDVNLSGASSARVTVNESIDVTASGASSLKFKGEGVIKSINTSGASSVEKLD